MSSSEGEIPPAQEARTFVPEQASKLQDEKLTAQDQTAGVEMSPLSAHDQRAHIAPEEHAVEALKRPTSDLPQLTIAYHNASVGLKLSKTASDVKTIVSPLVNLARTITGQSESRILWRIRNASGCIKPASMTMILAPPGHGKSSLLRLMCERLEPDTNDTTAGVRFNGHTVSEAADAGCNVRRLCHIVDQIDEHLPLLTVRETLDFAHQCTSLTQDPKRVPSVIKLLGLEECENTILGNALIRGVSGGQKRRVTVGEMLVGDARAIFLDEYTNGLDTATSEDITRGLRKWARDTNSSVVAAVQQPTPGLFEEFDDVIILNNADVIYHGPREDVVPFFASMGFNCPDDVDVCDFVVDCVSQPRVALQRLQHGERRAAKIAAAAGTPAPDYSAARQSTKGLLALAPSPCVSGQAMLDHYHASPFYHAVLRAVKPYYPSVQLPAAAVTAAAEPEPAPAPLLPSEHARAVYAMGYVQPLWTLLSMVAARQAKVFVRNKGMIMPRIFQAILMGLINGSLYYMVPESSFTLRVAILLICVAQTGFANMQEVSTSVAAAKIVYRQCASGMYPPFAYVLTAGFVSVPLFACECALLGLLIYFLSNCYASAGAFFTFAAILLTQCFNIAVWFRFISSAMPSEAAAQSIAGPSTGLFLLLGGFFVQFNAMPVWMQWLMWISPFNWSLRALANNEFLSSRYDELADNGERIGNLYLNQLDMKIGVEWIGFAVLYLMGLSFFIMALHSMIMYKPYFESSIGTRRFDEAEVLDTEEEKAADDEVKQYDAAVEEDIANGLEGRPSFLAEESRLSNVSGHSGISNASFGADSTALKTLREALPFTPMWLSFENIRYTVKVKSADGTLIDRPLLRGVNGYAEPGKLTALMGASGAGKTTLLDVLAGRKNTGVVEGKIKFNGRTPTTADVAYHTGYVEQFDSLFPYDTVHETLLFAARLRLPASVSDEIKCEIVEEIMDILELTPIRDYIIGNARIVGLSPSQLKRVNIGCELVANPAILFLDEPTTGLDSRAAQTVMRVVRRIARSGRSVICTIHQPSAELFYLFDRLVLLASGGHQVFFGGLGVRCKNFIPYIQSIPGVSKCPPRYNPASWMLEEMGVGQTNVSAAHVSMCAQDGKLPGRYDDTKIILERFKSAWLASRQHRVATDLLTRLDSIGEQTEREKAAAAAPAAGGDDGSALTMSQSRRAAEDAADAAVVDAGILSAAPAPDVGNLDADELAAAGAGAAGTAATANAFRGRRALSTASSAGQGSILAALPTAQAEVRHKEPPAMAYAYWLVQKRMIVGYWRNPPVMFARCVVLTVLSVLFGLIYFDLHPKTQASAISLIAVISTSTVFGSVNHGGSALPNLVNNRVVLYRELASDMYPAWMWGLSGFVNEAFYGIFTTFIVQIPTYFLVGLNNDPAVFFRHYFATWLIIMCYVVMAGFLAAVTPNLAVAGVFQGIYFGLFNTFSGVAIPLPRIPRGWLWFFRIVPSSHVTEALVMNQIRNCSPLPLCGPMIDVVQGTNTVSMHLAEFIQDYLGFSFDGYGNAIGWMILFIGVVEILALVGITFLNFSQR